jgi:hypothetical protein
MYKLVISDTKRKQNNFFCTLKYGSSSYDFSKLVIKAKNTCQYIFFEFLFCMKIQYEISYIFERLGHMYENKIFFCSFSIFIFPIFQRKPGILISDFIFTI